ncbi:MAG TPA: hypothetical protein VFN04_00330 [Protaetiibacter sp.]|nr:hypothetical protein [Protaetiibacter sp.]
MTLEPPAPPTAFSEPEPEPRRPPQWRGAFASLGIGVGAALLGLLPWIITGMRLPLQNLWAFDTLPGDMPIAFLPFSQYTVTTVMGMLVVGWVAAGIATRALAARLPSAAPFSVAAGLLLVQIVAIAQAAQALDWGLRPISEASFYLVACVAVAFGLIAFVLVSRAPRAGAVIGLVLGALAADWWIHAFFPPVGIVPIGADYTAALTVLRWVPPVLVGAAIAWGGVRTTGRIIAAVVGILLLWVVPPLATAVTSAVGSRVLLSSAPDMLDYGWGVFRMALLMPELALPPVIVAVVVAALGIGISIRGFAATRSAGE